MVSVDDLLPRLMIYAPGCPEPLAAQALVDSAIDVCREALVVREVIDPFDIVAGTSEYLLDAPTQQRIDRVLSVYIGQSPLTGSPDDVNPPAPLVSGTPRLFYTRRVDDERVLVLNPEPNEDATGHIEVTLMPRRGATSLHDDLFEFWFEPVLVRARAMLAGVPGQPFSDYELSASLMSYGRSLTSQARVQAKYGRHRGQFRVTPRSFV